MRVNIEVLHITSSGFAGDQTGWLYSIMLAALPMHVGPPGLLRMACPS